MHSRELPRLGRSVSVIGLGCWQLGADWGAVDESTAGSILHAAADSGVTFFDTADVYGDGRSEKFLGRFLRERAGEGFLVATKTGRRAMPPDDSAYTEANIRSWIGRSLDNLGVGQLDLVQWHCPPGVTLERQGVYDIFDSHTDEGLIAGYGVSIETVEQALNAIQRPQIKSIQIIANAFRLKPFERVMPAAQAAGVGVIARIPLASGLLAAKYTTTSSFGADDHRLYNRNGEVFDMGETFSGVPFELGIQAAAEVGELAPSGVTPAQAAIRWLVDQPGVTTVIPGATSVAQVQANAAVADLAPTTAQYAAAVHRIYGASIAEHVHGRW